MPLTHRNLLTNIADILKMGQLEERDITVGLLPPFHSFGLTTTVLLSWCLGLRTVFHPNPTESALLAKVIDTYKATVLFGTPTFLGGIVRVAGDRQLASLRLAVTGAEKCPDSLFATLAARCPSVIVLEGYGITECSPVVAVNPMDEPVPGTIGKLMPSVEGAVVDLELTRRVAPGDTGMLLVRGPSIFGGYLNYAGESPFVTFDGKSWYRTGDLVAAGADGRLTFQGRLKRFIKLGGEMVSLPAIEAVLQRHFGEADDGPVIAVEAIGAPRPSGRRAVHEAPGRSGRGQRPDQGRGTERPALRPPGRSGRVDPGARHRQDRLPGAEGAPRARGRLSGRVRQGGRRPARGWSRKRRRAAPRPGARVRRRAATPR